MVAENKEKEFRKKLINFLKSYEKVKKKKGDPQKLVDNISSKELHDMAEDYLKTKKGHENMKGGKRSRRRKRKRKNRTRKIQHGGQWELFGVNVVYMVGAAVAAVAYRTYNRISALRRAQEEFDELAIWPPQDGIGGIVGVNISQNDDGNGAWVAENEMYPGQQNDGMQNAPSNFTDAMVVAGNELLTEDARDAYEVEKQRREDRNKRRRDRSRTPKR